MSAPRIAVVKTGLANLASVLAGLRRAGAEPFATEEPSEVAAASHVMLPGVGAFGAAMETLNARGLTAVLRERVAGGRPTMAICLGLQLLAKESEETPGIEGLACIDKSIGRLPDGVRVPQLGWNHVEPVAGCRLLRPGFAYFANSYCLPAAPEGWSPAYVEHGIRFVAAMEKGSLLACQFHPELSGAWGLSLLKRWLGTATGEDA